jgi:hypothetical protein
LFYHTASTVKDKKSTKNRLSCHTDMPFVPAQHPRCACLKRRTVTPFVPARHPRCACLKRRTVTLFVPARYPQCACLKGRTVMPFVPARHPPCAVSNGLFASTEPILLSKIESLKNPIFYRGNENLLSQSCS